MLPVKDWFDENEALFASLVTFLDFSVEKKGVLDIELDGDGMNDLRLQMEMSDMTSEMMMAMDGMRGASFPTQTICSDQTWFENLFEKTKFSPVTTRK